MAVLKITTYRTVEQAAQASEFYAVNTSDLEGRQNKGQVVLGIKTSDGAVAKIIFPPTWVPLDLTSYATKDDLGAATTLRDYVREGLITLINKDTYDKLVNLPPYAKEFERIFKKTLGGTSEKMLSVASSKGTQTFDSNIVESPITENILKASTDQELVDSFDSVLAGISLGELKALSSKAAAGSIISIVASDLESMLINGGITIKSITELDSYKDLVARGISVEPALSF